MCSSLLLGEESTLIRCEQKAEPYEGFVGWVSSLTDYTNETRYKFNRHLSETKLNSVVRLSPTEGSSEHGPKRE